jgi:serine/threonine protein kinase/formylglycine-generating enzyme required for sulfatase activity
MDPLHSKSTGTTITVDFLRDRIRRDRDAGDLRPLNEYLAAFSAEDSIVAQAYFSVCQESAAPPASHEATVLNRTARSSGRSSILSLGAGGPVTPIDSASGGDHVGPYRLIKELGRGGQGAVHLAEDTRLGRRVALKVLTGVGSLTDANLKRFHREAELASKLDHPAICAVYDFGAFEGVPYIAMRFVEGETLAKRISNAKAPAVQPAASEHIAIDDTPEPPTLTDTFTDSSAGVSTKIATTEVVRVMEKAARAIHAAHECGVIHRDLKPGNIMVDATGEPVVLDFGLARDLEGDGVSITKSGDFLGTPAYMSPEQIASGHIHLDRRSDVYSLGVTLYECLTLRRPFDAPTREALYQAILSKEPPDPRRINKAISADLKVVIETALNKDRDRRYVSAEAFANDLRRVLETKPIQAKPISPLGRLTRWAKRNPLVAAMVAAVFLSLSIGIVATATQWLRADELRIRAEDSATVATAKTLDWERLADHRVLDRLLREADTSLWPAVPDRVPAMEAWLKEAGQLADRLPAHRAALATMKGDAKPYDEAAKKKDRESFVEATERLAVLGPEIERLKKVMVEIENGTAPMSEEEIKANDGRLRALEREKSELEAKAGKRLTWEFESPADKFKHDQLAALVRDLDCFVGEGGGGRPTRKDVAERLDFARNLKKRTIDDYAGNWRDAIAAIAKSPLYGGYQLKEQLGLIPLGPDPGTGLFEFTEVQTGAPVPREAGKPVVLDENSALVFVLVPGGTFLMGAQKDDPAKPNYDPDARIDDSPPHEVTLSAFFISKYEMTQGQWLRFTGVNPSLKGPGWRYSKSDKVVTLLDPVEQVNWNDCVEILGRLGLLLPTEAQWEYAARGGTGTRWCCGDDPAALRERGNLADASYRLNAGPGPIEDWDDGYPGHAPVVLFGANKFGLYGVIGNVWEWCRDAGKVNYLTTGVQPGDGLRLAPARKTRAMRGGSLAFLASYARSAAREDFAPTGITGNIGVRPARVVQQ